MVDTLRFRRLVEGVAADGLRLTDLLAAVPVDVGCFLLLAIEFPEARIRKSLMRNRYVTIAECQQLLTGRISGPPTGIARRKRLHGGRWIGRHGGEGQWEMLSRVRPLVSSPSTSTESAAITK